MMPTAPRALRRDFYHEFATPEALKTAQDSAIHDTATRRYHHRITVTVGLKAWAM